MGQRLILFAKAFALTWTGKLREAQPIVDRMPRRTANPQSEPRSRVRGGRLVATATNPLPASRCRAWEQP